MEEELRKFQDFIGYNFKDEEYLIQSLTTPMLAHETGKPSYEYLETLGDAVIKLILILKLHQRGLADPGEITKIKASLESDHTLKKVAKKMKLQQYILKSNNQEIEGTRIFADVFEAICGAMFLDSSCNFNLVEKKMINPFFDDFDLIIEGKIKHIKSELLEMLQGRFKTNVKINLEYEVSGHAHDPKWIAKNPKIIDVSTQEELIEIPLEIKSTNYRNKQDAEEDIYMKIMEYLKSRII